MRDTSSWEQAKHRVLTRWPALTEDDLEPTEGRRDELIALLEGRLGYAHANAEHDIDQILEGDSIVPKDVADETHHTIDPDTRNGHFTPADAYSNGRRPVDAFDRTGGASQPRSWASSTAYESKSDDAMPTGMAWPWRATAAMAAVGTIGVGLALRARRKSQRKHLVIPLPTQAESTQAVEAVGRVAGSSWQYVRSFAVLLIGGIAGWGVRRYQAM